MAFKKDSSQRIHGGLRIAFLMAVLLCASGTLAHAQRFFYVPYIAPEPWETTLLVSNATPSEQTFFAQMIVPGEVMTSEKSFTVAEGSTLRLDLRQEMASAVGAIIQANDGEMLGLTVEYSYQGVTGFPLSNLASQSLIIQLPKEEDFLWLGVSVVNTGDTSDQVTISARAPDGEVRGEAQVEVAEHGLAANLLQELFPDLSDIDSLHIQGTNRLLSMTLFNSNEGDLASYPASPGPPIELDPDPEATYFVVGNPEFGNRPSESYIVQITDPALIEEAREIISDPSKSKIVVGPLARGHGGFNRNLTEIGRPAYSWHVEAVSFADFTVEVCDGNPMMVEYNLNMWVNDVGQICFWNPTIVEEVSIDEIRDGFEGNSN